MFLYGGLSLTLPAVVDVGGFQTEVIVTNTGGGTPTLTLTFGADSLTTPDGTTSVPLKVNRFEQVVIPSFVSWLREQGAPGLGPPGTPHAGALFVTGAYVYDLVAGGRTWIPGGGGGTASSTGRSRSARRWRARPGSTACARTPRTGRTSRS